MMLRWAHTVFWVIIFLVSGGPAGLVWGAVFVFVRVRNHQRVARLRRDAAIRRVGSFDVEAAAREAEAFGLPSEVFRMTLPEAPTAERTARFARRGRREST